MLDHPRIIQRYALFDEIAAGGMGVVHIGRLVGSQGFSRIVAIKRLHPQFAKDADFVDMFVDEARLAARVRHPNVVATLDVVEGGGEILLVMEYVHGETLSRIHRQLRKQGERVPLEVTAAILHGVLQGLHAAHEAKAEHGAALNIVHRDVSPQNVLVGADGTPRVLDFGVAKAEWRAVTTGEGQIKGKLPYMAPEQLMGLTVDRRIDIYAAGIVLWEALTGARLFDGDNPGTLTSGVLAGVREPPSARVSGVPAALDAVVMRALARDPSERFQTALEMSAALERAGPIATSRRVGEWLVQTVPSTLTRRAEYIARIESRSSRDGSLHDLLDAAGAAKPLVAPESPGSVSRAAVTARSSGAGHSRAVLPVAAAGVLLVAGAIGAGLVVSRRGGAASAMGLPALRTTDAPPIAPAAAGASAPVRATASVEGPRDIAPPPSSSSAAESGAKTAPRPGPSATLRPAARPPASPPKCDPPYTIDAKGVRVPKRECF